MRSSLAALAALAACAWLVPSGALAGTLTSATWTSDLATGISGLPLISVSTGGGGLQASGTSTGSGASVLVTVLPVTSSSVFPGPPQFTVAQNLSGSVSITITPGGASANQPVTGAVNVFLFAGIPLFFLSIPFSVGISGTGGFNLFNPCCGQISVTGTFFAWTTGSFTATGLFGTTTTTLGGVNRTVPLPDFSTSGSFGLTGNGGGSITLVAPSVTRLCTGGLAGDCDGTTQSERTAGATQLTLHFVPEPRFALLLAGAAASWVVLVRRRD